MLKVVFLIIGTIAALLFLTMISLLFIETQLPNNSDKLTLEITMKDGRKIVSDINKSNVLSIHFYEESGTYRITYKVDNLKETLKIR